MTTIKESFILLLCSFFLICCISLMSSHLETVLSNDLQISDKKLTVVIDAGHGGFDSGKVGIDGTLEKNTNLEIAKKLEVLLHSADIHVIMTRNEDTGLYTETSKNKKREDMQNRALLMNRSNADCIISIHQNSFPDESIHGSQVFYYTNSVEGKTLAALLQYNLITKADPTNHRTEKSNDSYFLLKNVSSPVVIAECGFLSNWEESKKLVDNTYQHKLAWAIHLGILQYLNGVAVS